MSKLNPEFKKKWVEALRSGKYEQIREQFVRFRDDKPIGYCCLGVLCDVLDIEQKYSAITDTTGLTYTTQVEYENFNDIDKKTFPEIAGIVEENL